MDANKSSNLRSKRVRRAAEDASDIAADRGIERARQRRSASTSGRPTPAERQEALHVIEQMKNANPPIVPRRGQPPKANIMWLRAPLPWSRGEQFKYRIWTGRKHTPPLSIEDFALIDGLSLRSSRAAKG
jgi:hypothetical protein